MAKGEPQIMYCGDTKEKGLEKNNEEVCWADSDELCPEAKVKHLVKDHGEGTEPTWLWEIDGRGLSESHSFAGLPSPTHNLLS